MNFWSMATFYTFVGWLAAGNTGAAIGVFIAFAIAAMSE